MVELVPRVEPVTPELLRIELPYRPIDAVNVFVLPDADGLTLIDSGPGDPAYFEAIDRGLELLQVGSVADVHDIHLTHAHTDHIGQAGRFQDEFGTAVHAHSDAMAFFERRYVPQYNLDLMNWFADHGLPSELSEIMATTLPTRPHPPQKTTPYTGEVRIQGRPWTVVETSGHAPGHVALHQPDLKHLFVGDAVLQHIVPLVDIQPFRDLDTMHLYLDGLDRLRQLPFELVLPAHGAPFRDGHDRISQLIAKHQQRIDRVRAACDEHWQSAFELYESTRGRRTTGLTKMRMAFGQVIGYLGYLRTEGTVECQREDGPIRWRASR